MHKYIPIFILLLCSPGTSLHAQELKEDLLNIHRQFIEKDRFYSKMRVSIFNDVADDKAETIQEYMIKRDGLQFFYSIRNTDFLFNERCALIVNKEEKYVHYAPHDKKSMEKLDQIGQFNVNIDSVLNNCDSIVYHGNLNGKKKYIIYNHSSMIPVTEFYVSEQHNSIYKLVYYYNKDLMPENNKVEVEYIGWNPEPDFGKDEFSEWKYLSRVEGRVELSAAYDEYLLINNQNMK